MRFLMSLCNVGHFNSQFSLAVVRAGRRPQLVDCSGFMDPLHDVGVTGLWPLENGSLAVAVQAVQPRIVILDQAWRPVRNITYPKLADVHSLYERDGFLFVLCSGNNKILKVDLADGAVSLFWEYHLDHPYLHINSLIFHEGRPLVSSHKTPPESEGRAETAGVWYLDDYSLLTGEVKQPHTLVEMDGEIICLSSHDSRVVRWRNGRLTEIEIGNYLRGLTRWQDGFALGSSSRRFISRKQQQVRRYADFNKVVGDEAYSSSVLFCGPDFQVREKVDTTEVAFETYDLIPAPEIPEELLRDPVPVRMQTLQLQLISLRERVQALREAAGE